MSLFSLSTSARLLSVIAGARRRGPLTLDGEGVTRWRVLPGDLDAFGHMTNSRYLLLMDLARTDFLVRAGALGAVLARRWTVPLGCAYIDFHGELRLLDEFEIRTRLVYWDQTWFYFRQEFRRAAEPDRVLGVGHVKAAFRGPGGVERPRDVLHLLTGREPDPPRLGRMVGERFGIERSPPIAEAAGGVRAAPARAVREPIAIAGMGMSLPGGAIDPARLWQLVLDRRDCIVPVPEQRWSAARYFDPSGRSPGRSAVNQAGLLAGDWRMFDAAFFGIPPVEAEVLDPQQRLLLEVSWEALENAGVPPTSLAGSRTGVFVGGFTVDSFILRTNPGNVARLSTHTATSSSLTMLSNRLSYAYDLRGPSLTVDTACSSSLVAAHLACQSIWSGECDAALVGGVNALVTPETQVMMSRGKFLSPSGRCRSFAAGADGYVRGEGAVVLLLVPLSAALRDGNPVYATILGSAVNQDGRTSGITMPSGEAQIAVMREAYGDAGVDPADVVFVEAHGTGTAAGDPIEASSIGTVIGRRRRQRSGEPCLVGSIKSNIGHLEAAAGVTSLAKAALVLRHGLVPANLHFDEPNPAISFDELGVRVPTAAEPLPDGEWPRVVGVNGFGYGGTNAHVVLGEAPVPAASTVASTAAASSARPIPGVLAISARSREALAELAGRYADHIERSTAPLDRIARSAAVHRAHHRHRLAWSGDDRAALASALRAFQRGEDPADLHHSDPLDGGRLLFVYTGMGPQWWGMGRELMATQPVYRAAVEECDQALRAVAGWSIAAELARPESESRMTETAVAQPANAVLQIALTRLWASWGVAPDAVIGHSVGEVAAAHVCGALDLSDAMLLAYHRSRLQARLAGRGAMLAVDLTPAEAADRLRGMEDRVAIAAINSERAVTLAGERAELERLAAALDGEGRFARFLRVEVPYHSPVMEEVRGELFASLAPLRPSAPTLPVYSTALGRRLTGDDRHDAAAWWMNVRGTVLFADALTAAVDDGHHVALEIGPHPVLASAIRDALGARGRRGEAVASLVRGRPEAVTMAEGLARLYVAGARIDWPALFGQGAYEPVPHYPWQRKRHWSESERSRRLRHGDDTHPLVTAFEAAPAPCWIAELNLGQACYLLDHVVAGAAIFPAAGHVELAVAAQAALSGTPACSIEKLELLAPVPLSPDASTRLLVSRSTDTPAFQIHVQTGEDAPALVARGEMFSTGGAPTAMVDQAGAEGELLAADDFYAGLARAGLSYGPDFRAVVELRRTRREVTARLRLPDAVSERGYHLHPVLLDAAFHSLVALVADQAGGRAVVPTAIDRIEVFRAAGRAAIAHGVVHEVGSDTVRGDLTLVAADDGAVITRVVGFTCRMLERPAEVEVAGASASGADLAYVRTWREVELAAEVGARADAPAAEVDAEAHATGARGWRILGGLRASAAGAGADAAGARRVLDLRWAAPIEAGADPVDAAIDAADALRRSLAALAPNSIDRYVVVTCAAEAIAPDEAGSPTHAALLGLARTAMTERPDLALTLVDFDRVPPPGDIIRLVDRLGPEQEIAVRGGAARASRLVRTSLAELGAAAPAVAAPPGEEGVFELRVGRPGDLDSLAWVACPRPAPGAGEVEVAVDLVPLNFKDVAKVLGLVSARTLENTYFGDTLGMECVGRVARLGDGVEGLAVGDRVLCLARAALRSHVVQRAEAVVVLPASLSAEDAAGTVVYLTTYHALVEVARLQPGERLLVHSAAGGVGQSALQIARWIGAEVFATAGSEARRRQLLEQGVAAVGSSRDVSFADEVMRWTGGRGVDVVLNIAAGEVMYKSFACLAPGGRFVEVSKASFDQDAALKLRPFNDNLTYAAVDLDRLTRSRPDYVQGIIRRTVELLRGGHLRPLPAAVHGTADVAGAFRALARGSHVGKVCVSLAAGPPPRVEARRREARVGADGTYLVTGGLGGFGLECARWLVDQGARHLVLVGRRGPTAPEAERAVAELTALGASVRAEAANVSRREDLERLLAAVRAGMPPLRGVLHAAMVLDDRALAEVDRASIERVMAPKARGAWNLHELTAGDPLDFLVFFSSVSSLVGNAGQASYVAASSFLDALARLRRHRGQVACSVQWGVLGEVGVVARDQAIARHLERLGIRGLPTERALAGLGAAIDSVAVEVGLMDVDWSRMIEHTPDGAGAGRLSLLGRAVGAGGGFAVGGGPETRQAIAAALAGLDDTPRLAAVEDSLRQIVGRILRIDPGEIAAARPLREVGIDSILAAEITAAIEQRLGVRLPTITVTSGPPVRDLAAAVLDQLLPSTAIRPAA